MFLQIRCRSRFSALEPSTHTLGVMTAAPAPPWGGGSRPRTQYPAQLVLCASPTLDLPVSRGRLTWRWLNRLHNLADGGAARPRRSPSSRPEIAGTALRA